MSSWTAHLRHDARGTDANVTVEADDEATATQYALSRVPGAHLVAINQGEN